MTITDLLNNLDNEITIIQDSSFDVNIVETHSAPSDSDPSLTFENFDDECKNVKTIETCVLYVDIRKSTKLNLQHYPQTMAKLYSSYIRGMIKAAEEFDGKIRNIVGDRIMVVFDSSNCFSNSVNTAILMNTISQRIINKRFKNGAFKCGIGIDYGKMMVVKCGTIKYGEEKSNYKSLVWLGKPANVASKLTDAANQPSTYTTIDGLEVGFHYKLIDQWSWLFQSPREFVENVIFSSSPNMRYNDDNFCTCFASSRMSCNYNSTKPILITESVYNGFKKSNPYDDSIKENWWRKTRRKIPDFNGVIYHSNITFDWFSDGT
jgi:adenylate cyclase